MPTIIDSLLIKLGYDTSEVSAGSAKVDKALKQTGTEAEKTGKKTKKASDDHAKSLDDVAKNALKFLAIIGGASAIKRFAEQLIESGAALDRLSKNLGENVETVSAWGNAAELAGGDTAGLQGAFDMLSKAQTELMLTGESHVLPYFSALGVGMADATGKARPINDILLDISEKLSGFDRPTANNFGRMLGIDQGTMNLLLKGRAEVELTLQRQKEFNVLTKQQGEESSRLNKALIEGKQSFSAFGRELLSTATPALEKLFEIFSDVGSWMRENKEFVTGFLIAMAAGITALVVATLPVNVTALAVTALAAAFGVLYDDYQTWSKGGKSLFDWTAFTAGIDMAGDALKFIKKMLEEFFYRLAAFSDLERKLVTGDWAGVKHAFGEMIHGNVEETAGTQTSSGKIAPATGSPSGTGPRGMRNNNPGNLNFAGQAGATKESGPGGRFAVFGSMQEGVAALVKQIGLYVKRGKNTIRKIIDTYAPAFENNTGAYIAAVSRALGIGPDDPLDTNNTQQIMGLVQAIATHENGTKLNQADLTGGFNLARGIPNATQTTKNAGAATSAPVSPVTGGDRSVQTTIGTITVNAPNATDANGIAKDMSKSMNFLFASQADYGSF